MLGKVHCLFGKVLPHRNVSVRVSFHSVSTALLTSLYVVEVMISERWTPSCSPVHGHGAETPEPSIIQHGDVSVYHFGASLISQHGIM